MRRRANGLYGKRPVPKPEHIRGYPTKSCVLMRVNRKGRVEKVSMGLAKEK